jgi:hypothetical protein
LLDLTVMLAVFSCGIFMIVLAAEEDWLRIPTLYWRSLGEWMY